MAKLPEIFLQTDFNTQHIVDLADVIITINGRPIENIVDCQLVIESFGRTRIDIVQDEFIYNLRE